MGGTLVTSYAAAAALIERGGVVQPGRPDSINGRRRTIRDLDRLADYQSERPHAKFCLRLGEASGGLIALHIPGDRNAIVRMAELVVEAGPLPSTVSTTEAGNSWLLFRVQTGPLVTGKRRLGDGLAFWASGMRLALPGAPGVTWSRGASSDEAEIADLPAAWASLLTINF